MAKKDDPRVESGSAEAPRTKADRYERWERDIANPGSDAEAFFERLDAERQGR